MIDTNTVSATTLGEQDIHLFREGTHARLYASSAATSTPSGGARFAVWAPNAEARVGDRRLQRLARRREPGAAARRRLRHLGRPRCPSVAHGHALQVRDPHARRPHAGEGRPVRALCRGRRRRPARSSGGPRRPTGTTTSGCARAPSATRSTRRCRSTRCTSARGGAARTARCSTTASAARLLAEYVTRMGFTHVELMPITEHPFYGSWGYQTTGYFAPTSRYGTPQDFMYLVDTLHQAGIGVILDWVPSHFPADAHGLAHFDGTHLYEHADPRQGFHPDWNTSIFNYGRNEVRAFLLSSAMFWLDEYHIDGLRVDAVASMLYLDYSRKDGEWIPNRFGGRENLEAIEFLRLLNEAAYRDHPGVQIDRRGVDRVADGVAADLRGRPRLRPEVEHGLDARHAGVHAARTRSTAAGTTASSPSRWSTPSTRTSCCRCRTTRSCTARARCSNKMPGDEWQQFANLRLLFGYMWAHPGKKLLFMGGEFGQRARVEPRRRARLVACSAATAHARHAALGRGPEPAVPRRAGAARARLRRRRASSGSTATTPRTACSASCARRSDGDAAAGGRELHAGAARQLPGRRAAARAAGAKC